MPGVRCARSRTCRVVNTCVSHHGHTGITRHSPRDGLQLIPRSPRRSGFLVTVTCGVFSTSLTPASRRQDHTTSPSASGTLVGSALRVHRIPPHVRDDRETPFEKRRDGVRYAGDLGAG